MLKKIENIVILLTTLFHGIAFLIAAIIEIPILIVGLTLGVGGLCFFGTVAVMLLVLAGKVFGL